MLTDMGKLAWSDPKTGDPMKKQIPQGKFAGMEGVYYYFHSVTKIRRPEGLECIWGAQ